MGHKYISLRGPKAGPVVSRVNGSSLSPRVDSDFSQGTYGIFSILERIGIGAMARPVYTKLAFEEKDTGDASPVSAGYGLFELYAH
jgi:hypothetical protein